jgi:hypothetical protein
VPEFGVLDCHPKITYHDIGVCPPGRVHAPDGDDAPLYRYRSIFWISYDGDVGD